MTDSTPATAAPTLGDLRKGQLQPPKPGVIQMRTAPITTAATAKGKRRLVRVTCDVLLPEHYDGADLAGINVRNLRVDGHCDEMLYDLIQVTVQEARVELVEHG